MQMSEKIIVIFPPEVQPLRVNFENSELVVRFPGNALPDGTAMPKGGDTGQILRKRSRTDYAIEWAEPPRTGVQTITLTAEEAIGGNRAVAVNEEGQAIYSDKDVSPECVGISSGAADVGGGVTVQLSGEMSDPSWSFIPGLQIYLGTEGLLTQEATANGHLVALGRAISGNKIIINIEQPITL